MKEKKQSLSTSKKLILFLFINCVIIEIFVAIVTINSMWLAPVIGVMPDYTPLIALIGAVVGEVIAYAVYAIKSAKENTAGGVVYETAMKEVEQTYG